MCSHEIIRARTAKTHSFIIAILVFLSSSCSFQKQRIFNERQNQISLLLDSSITTRVSLSASATVRQFYSARAWQPAWTTEQTLNAQGEELLLILNTCDQFGLFPGDYPLLFLNSSTAQPLDAAAAAHVDVVLTDCYFMLAHQLRNGTLDRRTLQQFTFTEIDTLLLTSLNRALDTGSIADQLASHEPHHPCYAALKTSLQERLAALGGGDDNPCLHDDILTLQVNLERWRWEFRALPERHIYINIPSYTLYFFAGDSLIFKSRVIVGAPESPTPFIQSEINCLTVVPYESAPTIWQNSHQIAGPPVSDWKPYNRNAFWQPLSEFPNKPSTELCLIPEDPCRADLHACESKNAFEDTVKAVSGGCVRVEHATELARLLLTDNCMEDQFTLENALSLRNKDEFRLRAPVPVMITYCTFDCDTVWADVYGLDRALRMAVENPAFTLDEFTQATSPSSPTSAGQ